MFKVKEGISIAGKVVTGSGPTAVVVAGDLGSGAYSIAYSLPAASASVLGGVKIGAGLTIDGAGILSVGAATLASPAFTGTPTAPTAAVGTNTSQLATTAYVVAERASVATLTNKTLTDTVYTIVDGASVNLNPVNGGIQVWTLGANRTATASSFTSGQSLILGINDGSGYSLTFPTITWSKQGGGGSAPTLSTSAYTWIVLWKVGSTLYGSYLGDA